MSARVGARVHPNQSLWVEMEVNGGRRGMATAAYFLPGPKICPALNHAAVERHALRRALSIYSSTSARPRKRLVRPDCARKFSRAWWVRLATVLARTGSSYCCTNSPHLLDL